MSMVSEREAESSATRLRPISTVLPGQTPEGDYILSVLLKRTYNIIPNNLCQRAERDKALFAGDVYWDDPMNSSVRYESDYIPYKLATDVALNGKAYAPHGRPTTSCAVSLQIADVRKQILVIGDRFARYADSAPPEFTEPAPFLTMDLRYELAYGGVDIHSDKTASYAYPRNPLGRGFAVTNSKKSVDHLPLPNLEDPETPLAPEQLCLGDYQKWEQQPTPMGFGWFPKTWLPRAQLAGILPGDRATEQELRQAYAKLVPAEQREAYLKHGLPDVDFRFFNGASSGLALPYLTGGEQVTTENLSAEGTLSFQLPSDKPSLGLDIGAGIQTPPTVMHTVMIRMEDRQVDIIWRAAISYAGPDWLPQMKKLEVVVN